ncbi:hypothetical protein WUBG_07140 [Wuchereria bancrofti]|uniref:C2H2-type domain-containing protein n=1 Tax=Wuchereria bancrofti TaxID=6293 RepID=J9EXP3_WUCBA|nr:hypothetical protein WUBG_07140 [Wuchereria bancrofti]
MLLVTSMVQILWFSLLLCIVSAQSGVFFFFDLSNGDIILTIHWIKIYEINRINQVIREDDNIPDDFEWLLFGYKKPMQPSAVKTPSVRGNPLFKCPIPGCTSNITEHKIPQHLKTHKENSFYKCNCQMENLQLEHTLVNTQEEDASSQSYNILDDFNLALFDSGTGTYGNTDEISS